MTNYISCCHSQFSWWIHAKKRACWWYYFSLFFHFQWNIGPYRLHLVSSWSRGGSRGTERHTEVPKRNKGSPLKTVIQRFDAGLPERCWHTLSIHSPRSIGPSSHLMGIEATVRQNMDLDIITKGKTKRYQHELPTKMVIFVANPIISTWVFLAGRQKARPPQ